MKNARMHGALRWRHREMVAQMEADVPGTRHGLVRMADQIGLRDQVVALGSQTATSSRAVSTLRKPVRGHSAKPATCVICSVLSRTKARC